MTCSDAARVCLWFVLQRYEVQLQPGDIIVAGTDGLWDNCFHEEIVSVLR